MSGTLLDVYVDARLVGTLTEEAKGGGCVFTYLPDVPDESFVSLLMPVRAESYVWKRLHPFFQMNLPEGYKKDRIRDRLGPHADVSDMGLLALTGARSIGRVQVVPHGVAPAAVTSKADMASLLASTDSRDNLLKLLEEGITEGVSGVMPKALARAPDGKATVWTDEFILKTGFDNHPWLSVNEYLCLEVARHAGLDVPETRLSADGQVLAIRRFDRPSDGRHLAVEDFCALKGLDPTEKYKGTLEDLSRLSSTYIGGASFKANSRKLHRLHLLNYALRNADAHLKNFALTYTDHKDVQLAPVYDIVTVPIYPALQDAIPALNLAGKRVWISGKLLMTHGATRLGLTTAEMSANIESVVTAVHEVVPRILEFAERYPGFRELAKLMLGAWGQGLDDIRPDARTGKRTPVALRAQSGMSEPGTIKRRKEPNPYLDPDGPFGHKAR